MRLAERLVLAAPRPERTRMLWQALLDHFRKRAGGAGQVSSGREAVGADKRIVSSQPTDMSAPL
jgi:hypothetical protein